MKTNPILHGRLYYFLLAAVFISLTTNAKTGYSGKEGDSNNLNITPFGIIKSWKRTSDPIGKTINYKDYNSSTSADSSDIGIFWWDARDINKIEVIYNADIKPEYGLPLVQYWQQSWPETPPRMPSKEDLEDDAWQGIWVTAATEVKSNGSLHTYTFKPLTSKENPNSDFLPGPVMYRRTLKIRLVYPPKHQLIKSVNVFSVSGERSSSVRFEHVSGIKSNAIFNGTVEVFNGRLVSISPWHWDGGDKKTGTQSFSFKMTGKSKGIITNVSHSFQQLPGSNDETVITYRTTKGTFSVSMNDIEKGPVYIPHFNAYITKASDTIPFARANIVKGKTTRERILEEPEQSYDRARNEIPALDPVNRIHGGYIDLPLAADASWQKFAVQWGGNIIIDKAETKAQGNELLRCNWTGNGLRWNIGTGENPEFNRTQENCQMSVMNDYLPVVQAAWTQGGLNYREEAFATLLRGPLSPEDPGRNEQTPAILMVKLTVSNPSNHDDTSHIWLSGNNALAGLSADGDFIMDRIGDESFIRCFMPSLKEGSENKALVKDDAGVTRIIHRQVFLKANSSIDLFFSFPFVGDLTSDVAREIKTLDYGIQKNRIASYWRDLVAKGSTFNVPERKFNEMGKAIIPHIRISVTKDPKSGFYMVPAAAFSYRVYPNEAVFQTLLLDRRGDFKTSADYLNVFMKLQGSARLPGTFTGDQKDVFYGTRVDDEYNMTERNGYNMHHGSVLWGLARHYLYSGDREWLLEAAPHMKRAANWIIEQRNNTKLLDENGKKVAHFGLLPAGSLEDVHDWQFWYTSNAYACMGMESMAKAFERAGLPEADYYKMEAKSYHDDIRQSVDRASELCPVVRLRNNTYVPYVPARPYQRFRYFGPKKAEYYDRYNLNIYPNLRLSAIREALYGPIVLIKAGLIADDEPMAEWVLDDWEDNLTLSSSLNLNVHGRVDDEYWFSRGGMVFQANLQNPVAIYLLRNEIPATLRGLYDNFVSCLYPDINAHTEEYREWGRGSGPFYKCPDEARFISQVYDLLIVEKNEEIWLAAGTPRRWLEAGQNIQLNRAQTEYGEVSYTLKPGESDESVVADIQLPSAACSKLVLFVRAPFQKNIRSVTINGKEWSDWDAAKESIVIPQGDKNVRVIVMY